MSWQPIDTYSPKAAGHRQVLCCHDEMRWVRFGRRHDEYSREGRWYYSGTSERSQWSETEGDRPTHWQPIPDLPAKEKGG